MKTKVALGLTLLMNFGLIYFYTVLLEQGSHWWSALVLRDIVISFVIFLQMFYEYKTWHYKTLKWREELVF